MVDDAAEARTSRRVVGSGVTPARRVAIDARIAGIAGAQQGVITRWQLLTDVGLHVAAVDRRVAGGQLVVVHRGVYRLAGRPPPLGWAVAAALACGNEAVVSGHSAAAVYGIGVRDRRVEVTARGQRRRSVIDCRVGRLAAEDVTVHLNVPVTSLARTVYDIAARPDCPAARLDELVNRARILRPALLTDLDRLLARIGGRGRPLLAQTRLRPLVDARDGPLRSVFEQDFRRALARSNLPPAQFNVAVAGIEVDVLWPRAAFVVELDGRAFHSDPRTFESDRERDARLAVHHHQVIRLTWRRWRQQPEVELERLRGIILARTHGTHTAPAVAWSTSTAKTEVNVRQFVRPSGVGAGRRVSGSSSPRKSR